MRLSRKEIILAILISIAAMVFFYNFSGGPQGSDEIGNLNTALNNGKSNLILGRYFHIYLSKLFMAVAPTPLKGAALMWSFLMSLCGFLIYFCARRFTPQSTPLQGLLGIAFFLSSDFIGQYAGSTVVDYTAMAAVLLTLALFIGSSYQNHNNKWLLAALGAAFFILYKTKETTYIIWILWIGFGYTQDNHYDIKLLLKRYLLTLPGTAFGFVVFLILNTIFMKDPLFGLLPWAVLSVYNYYDTYIRFHPDPSSYYNEYVLIKTQIIFLLTIVSLARGYHNKFKPDIRLVSFYPFLLVIFLTLTMIRSDWGLLERYFYPGQMILCVLAPQFLEFRLPKIWKEWIKAGVIFCTCIAIWYTGRKYSLEMTQETNWVYTNYLETIIYPIVLSILLGLVIGIQRFDFRTLPVLLVTLFILIYHPIINNYRTMVIQKTPQRILEAHFTPLSIFADDIQFTPDMKMYVTREVTIPMGIGVNRDEMMSMFNVYFDASSVRENFTFSPESGGISPVVLEDDYTYLLLTQAEWDQIRTELNLGDAAPEGYQVIFDAGRNYVLLKQVG